MGYNIYLAKVVGECTEKDSRIQVRITPNMDGIPEAMCPRYPYFFKDELLTGNVDDLVWCICDDEFSSGYILGLANYNSYSEENETFEEHSIPVELQQTISDTFVELKASQISFKNIKVTHWNRNSIHFVERKTGGVIIAYDTGTLYILRPTEFIMKIGSSSIKVDADGISLAGNALKLQSEEVGLGNNPQGNVLVTSGTSGENAMTSSYVKA